MSGGFVDLHCHLLAGLDDGADSLEESVEFCRLAARDGVAVTVGTPHVREGRWENSVEDIRRAHQELQQALCERGVEHRVAWGGEVHLTRDLARRARDGELPTYQGEGKYLLLELPRSLPDYMAEEAVESLRGAGIVPILAHPERIDTLVNRPELLYRLVRAGALSQVTGGALEGTFGPQARAAARRFLQSDLVHFLGSDAHSTRRRRPVLSAAYGKAKRLVGEETARRLVLDNPRAVLAGEDLEVPEPRDPGRAGGFFSRLFGPS